MAIIRKSSERGHVDLGWLNSYHSFSFGHYYDPNFMGFGSLRVINEDRITPGKGFPMHSHANMEIVTYLVEGQLEHRDSLGSGSVIEAGEIQCMSAGSGISHSEYNPSATEPVHLLQIWIEPDQFDLKPGYSQQSIGVDRDFRGLKLIASRDGREGSILLHASCDLLVGALAKQQRACHQIIPGRQAWIQIISGSISVNKLTLNTGDGVGIDDAFDPLCLCGKSESHFLIFDMDKQ
jgi:hypothetical protein